MGNGAGGGGFRLVGCHCSLLFFTVASWVLCFIGFVHTDTTKGHCCGCGADFGGISTVVQYEHL